MTAPTPEFAHDGYRRRSKGVQQLLALFDEIRVRPTWRQGDVPIPVLVCTGPFEATLAAAQAFDRRGGKTPRAYLSGPAGGVNRDRLTKLMERRRLHELSDRDKPSPAFGALARDAAYVLWQASQAAFQAEHAGDTRAAAAEFDRGGVLLALQNLPPIDGASGMVQLHGAANGHHGLDRPVLLVTVDREGRQIALAQCGRLYEKQVRDPACG